jgi:hypothetical protein
MRSICKKARGLALDFALLAANCIASERLKLVFQAIDLDAVAFAS